MVAFTRHGAGERAESFLHLDFQTARRESDFSNKAIPLNSATPSEPMGPFSSKPPQPLIAKYVFIIYKKHFLSGFLNS